MLCMAKRVWHLIPLVLIFWVDVSFFGVVRVAVT